MIKSQGEKEASLEMGNVQTGVVEPEKVNFGDIIAFSVINGEIEKKRKVCHLLVMGRRMDNFNVLSKWGTGEFEKPQYMHSALSIYLLIKYPHLRPANSFVQLLIDNGQEHVDAWLKIATDVLNDDPECAGFIKTSDEHFLQPDPNMMILDTEIK